MREARRPRGGVVGEERETWCHVREYARRVWKQLVFKLGKVTNCSCQTLPMTCDMVDGGLLIH